MQPIKQNNIILSLMLPMLFSACDSTPISSSENQTKIANSVSVSTHGPTSKRPTSTYKGLVVFYSYTEGAFDDEEQIEIDADFSYNVGNLLRVLDKEKIKHQIIYKSDFNITTMNGEKLRFSKKKIPTSVGYIMIKNNGKYLIIQGIGTDVDMRSDIYKYFKIK